MSDYNIRTKTIHPLHIILYPCHIKMYVLEKENFQHDYSLNVIQSI